MNPLDPDATLDTQSYNSEENAQLILELLISKGFVRDLTLGHNTSS
jgi:hypothetical protein